MSYRSEAWFSAGMESFAQLVTILVIVVGAMRILWGELTVADMLTFLLCVAVLVDPVKRLANFARLWQEGYTGFVRAMELLEVAPDITDRAGAVAMPRPGGAIRVRGSQLSTMATTAARLHRPFARHRARGSSSPSSVRPASARARSAR